MEKTHNQHGKQEKSATDCNSYQNDTSAKSDNTDLQGKINVLMDWIRPNNPLFNIIKVAQSKQGKQKFQPYGDALPCKFSRCGVAAIAQWFRLRLPFCGPGFESQAHHLRFFSIFIEIVMRKEQK